MAAHVFFYMGTEYLICSFSWEWQDIVLIGSYCHCMPVLVFSASSWQSCCIKFTVYYLACYWILQLYILRRFKPWFPDVPFLSNVYRNRYSWYFSLQYLMELLSVIAFYSFINWRWESIYTSSLKQGRNNVGD